MEPNFNPIRVACLGFLPSSKFSSWSHKKLDLITLSGEKWGWRVIKIRKKKLVGKQKSYQKKEGAKRALKDSHSFVVRPLMWRHHCNFPFFLIFQANEPISTGTLVLIVSALVGMIVVLICLCGSCHYCMLKASTASVGSDSETSSTISTIENWNNNSKYQDTFKRRTPTLE